MAAPTVKERAKTMRGKGKHHFTVKNVLFSPYAPEWPAVAVGETPKILEEMKRTFEPYQIQPDMKKMKEKGTNWSDKKWTPESLQRVKEMKKLKAELRTHIVFGVNATTRCLEKGQIQLVIVCRSSKLPLLTNHIMTLAACRGVPALALAGLSDTLSKMMKTRAIIAVGFKKTTDKKLTEFSKLANFIMERTPPIELPWLQYKDIPVEELRQKVMEASDLRKRGGKARGQQKRSDAQIPSETPLGPSTSKNTVASTSRDSISPSKLHGGEMKHSVVKTERTSLKEESVAKRDIRKKSDQTPACRDDERAESSHVAGSDGSGKNTPAKRTIDDADLDLESSKRVAKVSLIPGKVVPIRSVPKELKQEWKSKKKGKKNKKKKKR